MTRSLLPLAVALSACADADPCASAHLSPSLGAWDAPQVEIALDWAPDAPVASAELALFDGDTPVPGTLEADRNLVWFVPDAPLEDDRTYRIDASYTCDGIRSEAGHAFETRRFVQPVSDPTRLIDKVWGSRGDTFRLVEPAGDVGALLGETVHMNWLPLLHILDVDPDTRRVEAELVWSDTWADAPEQRPCSLPLALPEGRLENPGVTLGPDDVDILTGLGSVMVEDLVIEATVSQDGSGIGAIELTGRFDIRDLAGELGYASSDAFCTESAQLDYPCVQCSDGEKACLPFHIDGIQAELLEDRVVEREDVCGIADQLVAWGTEALYRSEPGGTSVTRVAFDGGEAWTTDLEAPIVQLSWAPDTDHPLIAIVQGAAGLEEWRFDPETGEAFDYGSARMGGGILGALLLVGAMASVMLGCSTTGSAPGSWAAVLLVLGLVGFRRR